VGAIGLAQPAGASGPAALPPHIVATPDNPMVNSYIELVGTGFAPNSTLNVVECGVKSWIVPERPCVQGNQVKVKVTSTGTFKHTMKAEFCPVAPSTTPPGPVQQCFIGVRQPFGVDEIRLEGVVAIEVSGP
jgi:hypothetical protein